MNREDTPQRSQSPRHLELRTRSFWAEELVLSRFIPYLSATIASAPEIRDLVEATCYPPTLRVAMLCNQFGLECHYRLGHPEGIRPLLGLFDRWATEIGSCSYRNRVQHVRQVRFGNQ